MSATGGQYFYKEFGDIPDVLHTAFEYADQGLTLTYSANLTSSKIRPRTIYGKDASMTIGADLTNPNDFSVIPDVIFSFAGAHIGLPFLPVNKGTGTLIAPYQTVTVESPCLPTVSGY